MTNQRKKPVFANREKGNIKLSLAIIFGLLLLIVLYLVETNGVVARNFELRVTQNYLKAKQDANQRTTISLMRVQSLNNLEVAAKDLNLVAVEKVGYLKVTPESFAFLPRP